ncbi:energy-coupling factor ABC transporter permease [Clostridium cylindrosporum]|uniref:ABC-type Co2+ transport system, permease component n=1 Tax=Clostridium cylindrosporum DSM 605 TaxID=1121307 RepID=A0A0J8D3N2_CLOCY|nr:energy-coupling factor ABC transporter permease [Clostridium cylindrosporum]KMT20785.1 ABC-type Co2+ transport system, permease component [Clostridium cylindrosporum DSM 605]
MHMGDALVSPAVGVGMMIATAGVTTYSVKKLKYDENIEEKIPLMGVMGAFVFAAQMINITIPGTGSSGHIAGGILLSAILGPYAAFLTMTSILVIQALLFGDGGLLALGCNIINMGFFSCIIGYKLIYSKVVSKGYSKKRIFTGSVLAATVALQLGSLGVVLQTLSSGITELPFSTFVSFMQPIHLVIGIGEGIITAVILDFLWQKRPDLLERVGEKEKIKISNKKVVNVLLVSSLVLGGFLSWAASSNPDGLEWSMLKTSGIEELETKGEVYDVISNIQEKTAILMDYNFKIDKPSEILEKLGTSVSGITGVTLTIGVFLGIGSLVERRKKLKIRIE